MKRQWILWVTSICAAGTTWAGMSFTSVTTTEGGKDGRQESLQTDLKVEGANLRMDIRAGNQPMMKAGNFMLTQDGGKTMYLFDAERKTYMKMDMEALQGMAGGMMQMAGGMMKMNFRDLKVEKISESKGPTVAGLPTTHYQFKTTYTLEMSFMGQKTATPTQVDEELWVTDKMPDAGFKAWRDQQMMRTGNKDLDALMKAEMEKVKGFPLKRMAVTTVQDTRHGPKVTKTMMEVTQLKEEKIPAAQFIIPAGYTEETMGGSDANKEEESGETPPPAMKNFKKFLNMKQGQ